MEGYEKLGLVALTVANTAMFAIGVLAWARLAPGFHGTFETLGLSLPPLARATLYGFPALAILAIPNLAYCAASLRSKTLSGRGRKQAWITGATTAVFAVASMQLLVWTMHTVIAELVR